MTRRNGRIGNGVRTDMKPWKRTLMIGMIIALTSQLYWDVFLDNFRISTSVILLPVLIMTFGSQVHTRTVCFVTALIVYLFRVLFLAISKADLNMELVLQILPNALFYIFYGLVFKLLIKNKHIVKMERLIFTIFACDLFSNVLEVTFQEFIQHRGFPEFSVIRSLILIAAVRTLFGGLILIGESQYRILLRREDHEHRYQRLFLMTTSLKNEIYFMNKNSEEIERVMSNAYCLYEKMIKDELPEEMQRMSLDIARDVHEIKKDYLRIIQGIQQEIKMEEYDEGRMSFQDILKILEESTYQVLSEKKLDVRLLFDCRDNFVTKEHYKLMAVLKNLVNNAIEAIESKQNSGKIKITERKADQMYLFEVEDDGPGILKRNLPRIFTMGYSTKFDEKTGNIYRGVGLCGVRDTVKEQFKGMISVESAVDKGTRFRVEIPAAQLEES